MRIGDQEATSLRGMSYVPAPPKGLNPRSARFGLHIEMAWDDVSLGRFHKRIENAPAPQGPEKVRRARHAWHQSCDLQACAEVFAVCDELRWAKVASFVTSTLDLVASGGACRRSGE
jgi:hypothetical protein